MRDTVEAEIYDALVKGREEKQRRESGEAAELPPPVVFPDNNENIGPNGLVSDDANAQHEEKRAVALISESNGGKRCPVCNVVFPCTMLNTEINAHLDSCLAE